MALVTVTREWTDEKGRCYECGDPAAFCLPEAYGPDHVLDEVNLRCAICAANAAAFDGERIVGLFWEDADGEPSPEDLEVINTYPIKENDMQDDKQLTAMREAVRHSLNTYEESLKAKLSQTPRGSGHAANEFDHLQASITEVKSAKRVLWMDN